MIATNKHLSATTTVILLIVIVSALACKEKIGQKLTAKKISFSNTTTSYANSFKLFEKISFDQSNIDFTNNIQDTEDYTPYNTLYIYNGGGVAAGDLNNDGLPDLVFTGNQVATKVYLNEGNFQFKDITEQSGIIANPPWVTGVTMVDINADGYLDVYICKGGAMHTKDKRNLLYINNGDLTFTEQAHQYNLDDDGATTQAYFFDYDGDNDLDAYIVNYPPDFKKVSNFQYYTQMLEDSANRDKLLENVGGKFVDVTTKAGLDKDNGFGLSASILDVNEDGYLDIYIANDFFAADKLFINSGHKTFSDQTFDYFEKLPLFTMGSDVGDINNDGQQDLLAVDMAPFTHERMHTHRFNFNIEFYLLQKRYFGVDQVSRNMLFLNQNQQLNDIAGFADVERTGWSWSAFIENLDNDIYGDILITNGIKRDMNDLDFSLKKFNDVEYYKRSEFKNAIQLIDSMPRSIIQNAVFKNLDGLNFEDLSDAWGMDVVNSQGASLVDLDNDGDFDLVFNNSDEMAFIYQNQSEHLNRNYLKIKLNDTKNTNGVGAIATIYFNNGLLQKKSLNQQRGFQSSSEPVIIFGLDTITSIDSLTIRWTDLTEQTVLNPAINTLHTIQKKSTKTIPTDKKPLTLFTKTNLNIDWIHKEDDFVDFNRDKLSPFSLSNEGPICVVADLNNDNLDDFIVGGSSKMPFYLFSQQGNKQFKKILIDENKDGFEISGISVTDFDKDGKPDILIATGGNAHMNPNANYKNYVYLNKGQNKFSKCGTCLPDILENSSVMSVDNANQPVYVFVGGRSIPGQYGQSPNSYLFDFNQLNQPKSFTNLGMVTDATWVDVDGNDKNELIVLGEWMKPMVLSSNGSSFNVDSTLFSDDYEGLWRSLVAIDVDQDGDNDLIAGNYGMNSFLKANKNSPLELLGGDFDQNSNYETLLIHTYKNQRRLYSGMGEYCGKMPAFFNEYHNNKDFANASIDQLAPANLVTVSKRAKELRSGIFFNEGNQFRFEPFRDNSLQLSSINDIVLFDFNKDGLKDLLIVGNNYANHYRLGNISANPGTVMINKGNGDFEKLDYRLSGLRLKGDVKSAHSIVIGGEVYFLFAVNNDQLQLYKLTSEVF
ncbi:MAG: VCBS repeat-containing protein [Chitinophagales bacterium]